MKGRDRIAGRLETPLDLNPDVFVDLNRGGQPDRVPACDLALEDLRRLFQALVHRPADPLAEIAG